MQQLDMLISPALQDWWAASAQQWGCPLAGALFGAGTVRGAHHAPLCIHPPPFPFTPSCHPPSCSCSSPAGWWFWVDAVACSTTHIPFLQVRRRARVRAWVPWAAGCSASGT